MERTFARMQWRIAAAYVALIALILLGLGSYLVGYVRAQQLTALESQLDREAQLIADGVQRLLLAGGSDGPQLPESPDALAKRLGRAIGARVTLIAADGTVLGDTDSDPAVMDNHAARPEVQQALRTGRGQSQRRSATLEQDLLYVAVPVVHQGTLLGVVRVALPVQDVQLALNRVAAAAIAAFGVAAVLAVFLATGLAQVTTRRLQALTQAAQRLAGGGLDQPVAVGGDDEVGRLARTLNDMAARLRAYLRAVEDERERLAAVLRHMADGVIIVGQDGAVHLINPAAARLLRVSPAWADGRSIIEVVRDHELAALAREALADSPSAEQPRVIELGTASAAAAGSGRRAVQILASRIPGGDAGGRRALLILQDVSELRRAEAMRREFVANVSHELRTPVAALKAVVETLEDGALEAPEVAREFLARMHVEVDGLAQLVEELLALSRIESGHVTLRRRPIDLGAVAAAGAERLRPQAERQGLRLTVDVPGGLPPVDADPEWMERVVVNLVHNALKFTPPGGEVTVRAQAREGEVAVVVADTGIGIPPEALPRLFERFYKVDRARSGGGTGLGLAIAKHVLQVHGGRIWAESAGEGQGATFTFALPVAGAPKDDE
jgi:two-component system phosphate regulon sensor histidine kinase PhoR